MISYRHFSEKGEKLGIFLDFKLIFLRKEGENWAFSAKGDATPPVSASVRGIQLELLEDFKHVCKQGEFTFKEREKTAMKSRMEYY